MTPERWKQIDELAQSALARGVDHRASFLDEACADDEELRREVDSQIAYQQQASKFLEDPAFKHAAGLIAESQAEEIEGRTFGHYRVLRKLGAGGMGEVYLAEDTRLKRKVALKLLPAEFTRDPDRVRRFEQEAQAASALNHPNIITIHEIGEVAGAHYIVTEYVAGKTLRARMLIEQQPLEAALELVLQVASALVVAHEAGIIHRDIKPENVMVRDDGLVKVLDFGLAKLTGPAEDVVNTQAPTEAQQSTATGVVLGTAAYMSPEQARGLKVDARTDIFSLGVMLYEMIAGHKPFDGATTSDVIAAVLRTEPPPLARYSGKVPETLEWIVSKALAKEREERHQTVKDLALDLRGLKHRLALERERERAGQPRMKDVAAVASGQQSSHETGRDEAAAPAGEGAPLQKFSSSKVVIGEIKRHKLGVSVTLAAIVIAAVATYIYFGSKPVLTDKDTILLADFVNTTGDAVFDDTLKLGLALQLEQSPFLSLFSDERAREVLRLMDRSPDESVTKEVAREICQRQGLKAMLVPSISSLGSRYVIGLEAVNAQTGEVIARQQVEADSKEQVLSVLGRGASKLREKLGESLSSIQRFDKPLEDVTTPSLEALKAFSLARDLRFTGRNAFEQIALLERAIDLDPKFAQAYTELAWTYANRGQWKHATEYAEKGYQLRERTSEREKMYISYAYYGIVTGEWDKAVETAKMWAQMYPHDAIPRGLLADQYTFSGQFDQAIDEANKALALDQEYSQPYGRLAGCFLNLNRVEDAKEAANQALAHGLTQGIANKILYVIGFVQGDGTLMKQQRDWCAREPTKCTMLDLDAQAAFLAGRLRESRLLSRRAVAWATENKRPDVGAHWAIEAALYEAVVGLSGFAKEDLAEALSLSRASAMEGFTGRRAVGPMALALIGDVGQAQSFAEEIGRRNPKNTLTQSIWLPVNRAAIELQRGHPDKAIGLLQPAIKYETVARFWPLYLRGQAYLRLKRGTEAAAEFQKILDHRSWFFGAYASGLYQLALYPLAHLYLARASVLTGDVAKSRQEYQNFFELWKDADADLPILIEAKKEYASLK